MCEYRGDDGQNVEERCLGVLDLWPYPGEFAVRRRRGHRLVAVEGSAILHCCPFTERRHLCAKGRQSASVKFGSNSKCVKVLVEMRTLHSRAMPCRYFTSPR